MTPGVPLPSARLALFLDFDGTLAEFAPTPGAVRPDPALPALLDRLTAALDGALALVSGRPIDELDALLGPAPRCAAGLHGLERRRADGRRELPPPPPAWLGTVRAELAGFAAGRSGLVLEDKGTALALHYRQAPECAAEIAAFATALDARLPPGAVLVEGSCVVEVRPTGADKGTAVAAFLREAPFVGRHPVVIGDDAGDLPAFRVAEQHGGTAIAVGPRLPARGRLADPRAVRDWLAALVGTLTR
jgi:trehalose 6-phosphate phosphatase